MLHEIQNFLGTNLMVVLLSVVHGQGPRSQRISLPSHIHPYEPLSAEMSRKSQIDVKNVTEHYHSFFLFLNLCIIIFYLADILKFQVVHLFFFMCNGCLIARTNEDLYFM